MRAIGEEVAHILGLLRRFFFFLVDGRPPSSCKPQVAHLILNENGVKEALAGKLLISILAGVTIAQLSEWVLPDTTVIRAMPNTPCRVRSLSFCSAAPVHVYIMLDRFGKA